VATRYLNVLGSEADRKQMHEFVQKKLNEHARHSSAPLPEEERCNKCDISWKMIARAVSRGDRQERILTRGGANNNTPSSNRIING